MKSKNGRNDECFVAASLAIVDGTHLCLLPPPPDADGSENNNSRKRIHRSSTSRSSGSVGNAQPKLGDDLCTYVPALPLSSVWRICCAYYEEEDAIIAGNDKEKLQVAATENIISELAHIETLRLHTSDLSNVEYRFIRSVSLVNGSSLLPMHVVFSEEIEEGTIELSDDMHSIEVCLPSFASDFIPRRSDEDVCNIYGGENYNISGDYDSMSNDHGNGETCNDPFTFEVIGAGCCLVADFLGIAGYEQALVSPRLNTALLSNIWNGDKNSNESIPQRKQLLQMLLRNSFVTDGSEVLPLERLAQLGSKSKTDNTMSINIPPLKTQREMVVGARQSLGSKSNYATRCSKRTTREEMLLLNQTEGDSTAGESHNDMQEAPTWLEDIAQTVEHRLKKEIEKTQRLERSIQARSELVHQGRQTVHTASRCNFNASTKVCSNNLDWSDPEILRLRYGMRPRTPTQTCKGISVMLDLECDVMMRSKLGSNDSNPNERNSSSSHALHDFHLSCSLANIQPPLQSSPATMPTDISTVSGIVPTFQSGGCITILASALLKDLEVILQESGDKSMLLISIQGLWLDASKAQNDKCNHSKNDARQGAVLCMLRLPIDTLFITPPITSTPRSGRWVQNEIDFTSNGDDANFHQVPSAIFEYRHPCTLIVDTSCEMDSTQDVTIWKELVSNLNATVGGNSFIDLYCKKGNPQLKLVIFGLNLDERTATVKLVLRCLPESAKLIIEDPDEKQNARSLLMSLKNEADALKRHLSLPLKEFCPDLLEEIAALQVHTDGIASTIKRGWV